MFMEGVKCDHIKVRFVETVLEWCSFSMTKRSSLFKIRFCVRVLTVISEDISVTESDQQHILI